MASLSSSSPYMNYTHNTLAKQTIYNLLPGGTSSKYCHSQSKKLFKEMCPPNYFIKKRAHICIYHILLNNPLGAAMI